MVGEFLYTNEYRVQFGYHNVEEKNSESMYVYRIPYEEITAVHFDEQYQMVTIIGAGEMLAYDDMAKKRVNQMKSQRKFYSNSPYSFILYIEEQDEFFELLNKNKGRVA